MSKKWNSEPVLDDMGEPLLTSKGKPVLRKSYSVLQDDFFNAMRKAGYDDVERGERGSSEGHLTVSLNPLLLHIASRSTSSPMSQLLVRYSV